MDHPIRHQDQNDLRRRMIQLFKSGYYVSRSSNIVFVCGGNEACKMRMQFRTFCENKLPGFEIFFPEFAMENYFSEVGIEPFDIAKFEEVVGELSHAIVIFPEAAGSFAETGYFSKVPNLSRKTILVLDSRRQKHDSFISLGPAKIINESSHFHPNIQMNYGKPEFDLVAERIARYKTQKKMKSLDVDVYNDLENFEKMAIIYKIVDLLSIATVPDIIFVLRGVSKSRMSEPLARQLISILVGAGHLIPLGDFGHLAPNKKKLDMLSIKDGFATSEADVRLALAAIYENVGEDFTSLVGKSRDAD